MRPPVESAAGRAREEGSKTAWEYEALFNRHGGQEDQLDIWSVQPTKIKVGKMGYRTKTTWAGDRLDAEVYPVYGRNETTAARAAKLNVTREAQKRVNDRRAERRIILLAETNFTEKDYHMTLTYKIEPTEERAAKDLSNFFGRVRRLRKKKQLPDLKYIYAMGGGEGEDEKRIHFHLMINGGLTREELEECWMKTPGAGRANTDRLQPNERGLEELSKYIFRQHKDRKKYRDRKETVRRFNTSRNLKKPKVRVSDSRCSNARVKRIAHDIRNEAKTEMEKIYPGYIMVECEVFYSDMIDGAYIRCIMRKIRTEGGRLTLFGEGRKIIMNWEMNWNWKEWFMAALVRAVKTFAQTFASMIAVGAAFSEVDWIRALSVSGVAFVLSILTSLGGLPEVKRTEPPDDEEIDE